MPASVMFRAKSILGATALASGLVFFPAILQAAAPPAAHTLPAATPDLPDTAQPRHPGDVAALNAFLDAMFELAVSQSPEYQTQLGRKTNYGKWDDDSESFAQLRQAQNIGLLKRLRDGWDPAELPEDARLNYRIAEQQLEDSIEAFRWRHHFYAVNPTFPRYGTIATFLINQHRIDTEQDARDYIARLNGIPDTLSQLIDKAKRSAAMGVVPPRFTFAKMIPDVRAVLAGAPFEPGAADSSLLADFKNKIGVLTIAEDRKAALTAEAEQALLTRVKPAYETLAAYLTELEKTATEEDGVWKLPDGQEFYRYAIKRFTTLDIAPDAIHRIGLEEVGKIRDEMHGIMRAVGFTGTLNQFFQHLRTDDRFFYPNTDEGRDAYIKEAERVVAAMTAKLDELFVTKPKAPLVVKRVEPFREKSAPPAFYDRPSSDGSRPGIYYTNLYNMREMPKWQMEAIIYHEGIPGHHMQIAIAQELQGVPTFRKFAFFGSYLEGWGLYSERLPKEVGFYRDPYADFGRLTAQIWRAVRLVVDSGLHAKKWTRQQAIDYMMANTPLAQDQIIREVDRYIVAPGQATSYYVGMLKILELRDRAKAELGSGFTLRDFHEVVLGGGAMPLPILEDLVNSWIAARKRHP